MILRIKRSSLFMKTVTFNILVDNGGELSVDIDMTEKEFTILKKFSTKYYYDEDSEEFEDCEKLSDLYNRIKNDAYDEMANSAYDDDNLIAEFCDGKYDFDKMRDKIVGNFDITIEWPEIDED
jgi:hypothetical protein